ncbi:hypothetical protein T552_00934 [Pneumocystis carinii B80]|uniref:Uncharacterized protein n=1 Tax=Pneumocystis carinii (strain B80) TaxID=1408658 RepID=A0A0W4ZMW7_PNEC8|nr:hypothetical protein T552_00934 [Pneumocystis carinii B80]KTW29727.1 hypothetical protein T552_00934 [Pneumocystis carinii B80]
MSNEDYFKDSDQENTQKDLLSFDLCKELNKEALLKEDFCIDDFLKNIYKFDTLEDLQIKLKELLKSIEKDIYTLTYDEYNNFFKVACDILENENRIIDLSIRLTKFKDEVQKIHNVIQQNVVNMDEELRKKKELYRRKALATNLLNINMMIEDMENLLCIDSRKFDDVDIIILQQAAKSYISLKYYLSLVPLQHPFIEKRKEKIQIVQNNFFDYLASTLHKYRKDTSQIENLLKVLQIYREIDASQKACYQLCKIK